MRPASPDGLAGLCCFIGRVCNYSLQNGGDWGRGKQVLLDKSLAELYDVETKALNQAVKRNMERFPEDFCFQLTAEEAEYARSSLRSQIVTLEHESARGRHSKYLPYAFTEQGVAMLSAVLRSETAIQVSIAIMKAFVSIRKYFAANGALLDRMDSLERHQVAFELDATRKFDQVFNALDELRENPNSMKEFVFLNGERLEANVAYTRIYGLAKKSIVVVDDYVDVKTLDLLRRVVQNAKVTLISDQYGRTHLTESMITDYKNVRPDVTLKIVPGHNVFHDRFIYLDYGCPWESLYDCGPSSKDAGNKIGEIRLVENREKLAKVFREVLQRDS